VCIDKVYIHTQESPSFEVLLPSKKKTTMGVEFDISNSINKFKIDIQDTEAKDAKIDAVWKYLNGEGTKNISFTGELDEVLLKKIFPQVSDNNIIELLPFLNKYLVDFNMNSCQERIMFFTQIAEETNNLELLEEGRSGWASSTSKYRGRGMFQLTGSRNYRNFEDYCKSLGENVDFINNPSTLAEPKYSVLSAFWFWDTNNCKRYSRELTEDNMLKIAKVTNCGSITSNCAHNDQEEPCYSCEPNGWARRKLEFERLKQLFPCN
ncbi:glycoside hydrolase family 19 protein, partial [Cellulophaga sp. BC115SP]|uniref:glycoside hydrolase family 19 protein n=1 Tax=Cellulophaga sp. BC115SP TaxID=2683263 RepID=UPI00351B35DB|nr:hypothetical protein [Cellulophaga sp. BC115SP]